MIETNYFIKKKKSQKKKKKLYNTKSRLCLIYVELTNKKFLFISFSFFIDAIFFNYVVCVLDIKERNCRFMYIYVSTGFGFLAQRMNELRPRKSNIMNL